MNAVHLICRREEGKLKGLTRVEGNTWRSCCWVFSEAEARSLIGGWIYLHPESKSGKSEFGGLVSAIEAASREAKAIKEGWAFLFDARLEGRNQAWRGNNYSMAWTSGIVSASYVHEVG